MGRFAFFGLALLLCPILFSGMSEDHCMNRRDLKLGYTCKRYKVKADGTSGGYSKVVVDSLRTRGDSLYCFFSVDGISESGAPVHTAGHYICIGTSLIFDPLSLADHVSFSGPLSVEKSTPIVYPLRLKTGDTLQPWQLYVTITETSGAQSSIHTDCTSRMCTGRDTITIEGKEYDTWLVDSYGTTVIKLFTASLSMKSHTTEWVSPVYGVLKTKTYSASGLVSTTLVTPVTE